MTVNYIVLINGRTKIECETESDVWNVIGSRHFGALYSVSSPTGKDCSDFIPF